MPMAGSNAAFGTDMQAAYKKVKKNKKADPFAGAMRKKTARKRKALTSRGRKNLASSSFALPGRRYPVNDISHARNALARVSQNGSPSEKAKVRGAVGRKFPSITMSKKVRSKKTK